MNTMPSEENVLHFLSDLPLHLAPGDDIRGKQVHDPAGNNLGKVHDLVVSHDNSRVLFVEVENRTILSHRKYLIPVGDILIHDAKGLFVRGDGNDVGAIAWCCPDLVSNVGPAVTAGVQ